MSRFVNNDFRRQSSVTEMLQKLKWDSLQERRARSQLVMLYKIQHQQVAIPAATYLVPSTRSTRGHDIRYLQPHTRILVYKYSYFPTAIRFWNTLPATVVGSLTLEQLTRDIRDQINTIDSSSCFSSFNLHFSHFGTCPYSLVNRTLRFLTRTNCDNLQIEGCTVFGRRKTK